MTNGSPPPLLDRAQAAFTAGDGAAAAILFEQAIGEAVDPRTLNLIGNRLLSLGRHAAAGRAFERATDLAPDAAPLWLNLATARRLAGDSDGELEALDRALAADPYFGLALIAKGEAQDRKGLRKEAVRTWQALIACAPAEAALPPAIAAAVARARSEVARHRAEQIARIRAATSATGARSERFDHCLALLAGEAQRLAPGPDSPRPIGLYFPGLPEPAFFDPDLLAPFRPLEQQMEALRGELVDVLRKDAGLRPYIGFEAHQPVNQWAALNHDRAWSAYFLWEDGAPVARHVEACPRTAALLAPLPLLDVPGLAPTAMFSILSPGAHIPPHHGVTNTRVVIHLPLIVPPDCGFRVGSEVREWREGELWAFDDTIEHEAWNRSDRSRAILIVDGWNPYLTEDEKVLLRATMAVIGEPLGA